MKVNGNGSRIYGEAVIEGDLAGRGSGSEANGDEARAVRRSQ